VEDAGMTVLFDDDVHVHYRFLWLAAAADPLPDGDPHAGQNNGLCGAAVPGALGMVTGLHTGSVPVRVEALDAQPPLDEVWEDVVEVSFFAADREYILSAFGDFHELLLPQAGDLRARWSARGMDAAREADTRVEDEPAIDAYLLQLWPSPPAPGFVRRQTSAAAGYWHGVARSSAPPPGPEQRAQQADEQQHRFEREEQVREAQDLLDSWGGTLPSPRVLALGYGRALELAQDDRRLLDAVERLDDQALRQLTAWVCRVSCRRAGLEDVDWVAPALTALERGAPLPPPFNNPGAVWDRLSEHWASGTEVTYEVTVEVSDASTRTPLAPEAAALDALLSTDTDDALAAAIDALVGAASCFTDPQDSYDEVARHLAV
jgi:hypothetical protein